MHRWLVVLLLILMQMGAGMAAPLPPLVANSASDIPGPIATKSTDTVNGLISALNKEDVASLTKAYPLLDAALLAKYQKELQESHYKLDTPNWRWYSRTWPNRVEQNALVKMAVEGGTGDVMYIHLVYYDIKNPSSIRLELWSPAIGAQTEKGLP